MDKMSDCIRRQSELSPPVGLGFFCFPTGDPNSKVVIVGEAPGEHEEIKRTSFCDAAGRVLDYSLRNIGLSRQNVYVTNVFKFRPPDNNLKLFVGSSTTQPQQTEFVKQSIALLYEELACTQANIIVAAGAMASYALTGFYDKITKRRGSIYWNTTLQKKVLVVLHPAAILRLKWIKKNDWCFLNDVDYLRLKSEMVTPEYHAPERELKINPTFNEAIDYVKFCSLQPTVYFDLETLIENQEITHISLSHSNHYAMSISLTDGAYGRYTVQQETDLLIELCKLLENPSVCKTIHNVVFEALIMFRNYGCVIQNVNDTMVSGAIALPAVFKRLEVYTSIFTNEPYYKDENKGHGSKTRMSDNYSMYSAKDTAVLPEIERGLFKELQRQSNLEAQQRQLRLVYPMLYMGEVGLNVDVVQIEEEKMKVLDEIDQLIKDYAAMFPDVDIGSPKQLMELYYEKFRYHTYINLKTKRPTIDEKALKRLKVVYNAPGVDTILRHRTLTAYSKYLSMYLPNGRLYSSFNIAGTAQARTSSNKTVYGEGFNVQNLPPRFRNFVYADPGYLLWELDKEQAENRIVAYMAPDINMIRAFENGDDIHGLTGAHVFDVPYKDVKDIIRLPLNEAIKEYPRLSIIGDGTKSIRDWGKRSGHGRNYRLGARTLSVMYEMPEAQAKMFLHRYNSLYPGILHYHQWMDNQIEKTRIAVNLFGRSRYFTEEIDLAKQRALSYPPQSTVGELTNQWGIVHIWDNMIGENAMYKYVVPLDIVHDSVLFQIPLTVPLPEQVKIVKSITASLDQELHWKGTNFKIPTGAKCGNCWGALKKVDIYQSDNYVIQRVQDVILNLDRLEKATNYEPDILVTSEEEDANDET